MNEKLIQYIKQQAEIYGNDLAIEYKALLEADPISEKKVEKAPAVQVVKAPVTSTEKFDLYSANSCEELERLIHNCMNCELGACRNKLVFGKGNPNADILVIGEAPGADEDFQGLPFVGKAGQLLDKILASIDLDLSNCFISNIVKCRPPGNRDPKAEEIEACRSILQRQFELIQPKLILAVGRVSARTLLNSERSLSNMRGKFHSYHGVDLLVTYHPSALLRNPSWKRPTWEDMKMFKERYEAVKKAK